MERLSKKEKVMRYFNGTRQDRSGSPSAVSHAEDFALLVMNTKTTIFDFLRVNF